MAFCAGLSGAPWPEKCPIGYVYRTIRSGRGTVCSAKLWRYKVRATCTWWCSAAHEDERSPGCLAFRVLAESTKPQRPAGAGQCVCMRVDERFARSLHAHSGCSAAHAGNSAGYPDAVIGQKWWPPGTLEGSSSDLLADGTICHVHTGPTEAFACLGVACWPPLCAFSYEHTANVHLGQTRCPRVSIT